MRKISSAEGGKAMSGVHLEHVSREYGMGKTTMLRDACRRLSERGARMCVVDERSEIAAMSGGGPQLDVGPNTDVLDGCAKEAGLRWMLRAMSPQALVTDELGGAMDAQAVLDAVSCLPETDVLVNNAGICHYGLISQITQAQWDRLFAVNVGGIYHCVNAVLPAMLHRQSGCILNVSSMWGQVGASCEACYSATKGAVLALTKALAQELGPSGIRVNCVSPGVILTDMVANVAPEVLAELAQEAPLGKNGTPEDVARAMVYLAEAEFVTGQNLPVNGGFVL